MVISDEEVKNLLQRTGDVRGVAFKSIADYIVKEKGQEGLAKVEEKMRQWGVKDFNYNNIQDMAWYPIGWGALFVLASMAVFNWDEKEIRRMGENAPKVSLPVKAFFRFFSNFTRIAEHIPDFWQKHYTVGRIEVVKVDEENKEMILKYHNCHFHPALCKYLEGYAEKTLQLARSKNSVVKVKEIECSFDKDISYEAYRVTWT